MTNDGGDASSVLDSMVTPVHTIHESERLAAAERRMNELAISALPVVDDTGQVGGVITKTDLLRVGRVRGAGRERSLDVPDRRLREHASGPLELVAPSASVAEAARRMVGRRVHHVYVAQGRIALGVISTRELMRAVAEAKLEQNVGDIVAGHSVLSVRSTEPVGLAIDRLVTSGARELVVLEGHWPVGVFDQLEAMAAKDASSRTPVDQWMTPAIACIPPDLPVHRASARAAATSARALLVTHGPEVRGVLTGLDFASLLAA